MGRKKLWRILVAAMIAVALGTTLVVMAKALILLIH